MKQEKPSFSRSAKTELQRKFVQRYPVLQPSAFETLVAVLDAGRDWSRVLDFHLDRVGLSQGRYYVLLYLFYMETEEGGDAPSPSRIADGLNVTRPTITWLLDSLERDGFLERRQDSQDRRALTVSLTEKGRRFLDEFMPEQGQRINAAMANLDEAERRTLIALLAKIDIKDLLPV